MKYAILLNTFCCWMVAFMGVTISHQISRTKHIYTDLYLGWFWNVAAMLWFTSGLRLLFLLFGFLNIDLILFYIIQVFVAVHFFPLLGYVGMRLFNNHRRTKILQYINVPLLIFFVVFVFVDGISDREVTEWASDYTLSDRAFGFFIPVFLICFCGVLIDIVRTVFKVLYRKTKLVPEYFAASIALLIYGVTGFFDAKGIIVNWGILVVRGSYMVAALATYLGYIWMPESIRLSNDKSVDDKAHE